MNKASDYREMARYALRGRWMTAVLATLIAVICGAVAWNGFEVNLNFGGAGAGITATVLGQNLVLFDFQQEGMLQGFATYIMVAALIIGLVRLVIGLVVTVGYARFNLDMIDGEDTDIPVLFRYFKQWQNMFLAGFLQGLFIFLWSLLLIIPGIVAGYRYAMTSFILAENPELPASEAIDRSKELMNGRKFELFCLDLSFIGWMILSVLTMGIGDLWLNPYIQTAHAAFYRDITAPKAAELPPLPAEEA